MAVHPAQVAFVWKLIFRQMWQQPKAQKLQSGRLKEKEDEDCHRSSTILDSFVLGGSLAVTNHVGGNIFSSNQGVTAARWKSANKIGGEKCRVHTKQRQLKEMCT